MAMKSSYPELRIMVDCYQSGLLWQNCYDRTRIPMAIKISYLELRIMLNFHCCQVALEDGQ